MNDDAGKRLYGPFNRVEGDLEVRIEAAAGRITHAWVNAPLFRGFEQILHGRDPRDALVYTPRICGICSVSQSVAAARALADVQQLTPAPNGELATNLILAAENMADHLTHFYLFFMPDFARDCYADQPWFNKIVARFKAQQGSAARDVLPARAAFLHLTGLLAGKWPHSLALQPGGTTRPVERQEKTRLLTTIHAFRHFLQDVLFGCELEQISELHNADALASYRQQYPDSDFSLFLQAAERLALNGLGCASNRFMSYGAYAFSDQPLFAAGVWHDGLDVLDSGCITEDISHSWMAAQPGPRHPFHGSTIADDDPSSGYSWCKAPRLDGQVVEVGALARQLVDGHALISELAASSAGNVQNRVIARLLELARVVPAMERWTRQLEIGQAYCEQGRLPDEADGFGLVEAARGSLGHWLRIKKGRILNYQIIAPTTWNFSPRDGADQPGALELALQGTEFNDDALSAARMQHIIRSFDPCMVCTVH